MAVLCIFLFKPGKFQRFVSAVTAARVAQQGPVPRGHSVFLGPYSHDIPGLGPEHHHRIKCPQSQVRHILAHFLVLFVMLNNKFN